MNFMPNLDKLKNMSDEELAIFLSKNPNVLECSSCEDRDCRFNAEGLCYSISTILENVPSGIFTCSDSMFDYI